MLFPVPSPGKAKASPDFELKRFVKLLHTKGWRFSWEQSEPCPCKESADDPQGRLGCPVCAGRGWAWHSAQEVRAVVTRAQIVVDPWEDHGEWGHGIVNLSLRSEHLPGVFDRFTALDSVFRMQEITTRTSGPTDRLRYPIGRRTLTLTTGQTTVGVIHCRKEDANGDAEQAILVEGTDLVVDANGEIDWTLGDGLGTAPPIGRRYSATYTAHPMFESIEDAYSARDTRTRAGEATEAWVPMLTMTRCRLKYGNIRT